MTNENKAGINTENNTRKNAKALLLVNNALLNIEYSREKLTARHNRQVIEKTGMHRGSMLHIRIVREFVDDKTAREVVSYQTTEERAEREATRKLELIARVQGSAEEDVLDSIERLAKRFESLAEDIRREVSYARNYNDGVLNARIVQDVQHAIHTGVMNADTSNLTRYALKLAEANADYIANNTSKLPEVK